jgi:hypothetical protein
MVGNDRAIKQADDQTISYAALQTAIQLEAWRLEGIPTELVEDKAYPTGYAYVQTINGGTVQPDGSYVPFERNGLPADHIEHKKMNALLRMLGTTRGIDHVLGKKSPFDPNCALAKKRLAARFDQLSLDLGDAKSRERVKQIEKKFNTDLFKILHSVGLTEGITVNNAEELLMHYRYLAGLLDPAK